MKHAMFGYKPHNSLQNSPFFDVSFHDLDVGHAIKINVYYMYVLVLKHIRSVYMTMLCPGWDVSYGS